MKYLIAVGSPFTGIELYGPYESKEAAYEVINDLNIANLHYYVVPLQGKRSLEYMYGFNGL